MWGGKIFRVNTEVLTNTRTTMPSLVLTSSLNIRIWVMNVFPEDRTPRGEIFSTIFVGGFWGRRRRQGRQPLIPASSFTFSHQTLVSRGWGSAHGPPWAAVSYLLLGGGQETSRKYDFSKFEQCSSITVTNRTNDSPLCERTFGKKKRVRGCQFRPKAEIRSTQSSNKQCEM